MTDEPDGRDWPARIAQAPHGHVAWLVQCAEEWVAAGDAYPLRHAVDEALLRELFHGRLSGVRRLILYDLPSDAGGIWLGPRSGSVGERHLRLTRALDHWREMLRRHMGACNDVLLPTGHAATPEQRYVVAEVVLGRITAGADRNAGVARGAYDGLWLEQPGTVPAAPAELLSSSIWLGGETRPPAADLDPLSLLDD